MALKLLSQKMFSSLDNPDVDSYEMNNYTITEAKYYFVHQNFLFATPVDVFDLESLWKTKGNATAAHLYYWNLRNYDKNEKKVWDTVRNYCFVSLYAFIQSNVFLNAIKLLIETTQRTGDPYVSKKFFFELIEN